MQLNGQKIKIKNACLCRIAGSNVDPVFCDFVVAGDKIESIIEAESRNGAIDFDGLTIDARGRIVTPPLINFHEHIYSRLAKGLPLSGPMDNFEKILGNLWWKLDLALDAEMIKASTQMAAVESIRNGVTYIFDHHASPNFTTGSLELIRSVLDSFNLRGVLCFETSDRNGVKLRNEALNENISFCKNSGRDFKSMLGLHASFTLDNETLELAERLVAENKMGIHIHLCEDPADNEISLEKYNELPASRLARYNLINPQSILSHCVHLSDEDYYLIARSGAAVAFNIDSNLNNSVGIPAFEKFSNLNPILAGTDGMHASIQRSLKQLFLHFRYQGNDFETTFTWFKKIYFDQIEFARQYFPDFTSLDEGERADFVIWDYAPPTPVTNRNYLGHFVYGISERQAATVIQKGKILMREFKIEFDEAGLNDFISGQGKRLFSKFSGLD